MKLKTPSVFILGPPKSGTSSLYNYLREHPQIFLPTKKELHFFSRSDLATMTNGPGDTDALRYIPDTREEYLSFFSEAKESQVVAEFSTSYFYGIKKYLGEMIKVSSSPKFVLIFRNPVDRTFSNYIHQKRKGIETLDFRSAINAEEDRINAGWITMWRYLDQSYYSEKLKYLFNQIPKENILMVTLEEMEGNPTVVINRIFRFLNVNEDFLPTSLGKRFNKGGIYKNKNLIKWMQNKSSFRTRLRRIFPEFFLGKMRAFRDYFIIRNTIEGERISLKDRKYLQGLFKSEIQILENEFHLNFKTKSI